MGFYAHRFAEYERVAGRKEEKAEKRERVKELRKSKERREEKRESRPLTLILNRNRIS